MLSLEMFENIAYIMAKHADASVPDTPEEWLDGFGTFSIYQVLPQIIELWGLNVQTDVTSKKNSAIPNGRSSSQRFLTGCRISWTSVAGRRASADAPFSPQR